MIRLTASLIYLSFFGRRHKEPFKKPSIGKLNENIVSVAFFDLISQGLSNYFVVFYQVGRDSSYRPRPNNSEEKYLLMDWER